MNQTEEMFSFLQQLCIEPKDMEDCEKNIHSAVSSMAEQLRLGRVELKLVAPPTRLRLRDGNKKILVYDGETAFSGQAYAMKYNLPDKGQITISVVPATEEDFTDEEKERLQIVFRVIYMQYSRMMMEQLLQHVVDMDLDTGAATMDYLMRFAGEKLQRNILNQYVIVFFNIHNFKYVNKVFSYAEGDMILSQYTTRIQKYLDEDELIARAGGDNFVVLVKEENFAQFLKNISEVRIFYIGQQREKEFVFGATVGYGALKDIHEVREIMARASIAYASARKKGVGCVVEYNPLLYKEIMEKQSVLSDFKQALENREFVVYYQPKVNIQNRAIYGAEALVRWIKNGEIVPPANFIPLLEQEGSVISLDYYVLEEVCLWLKNRMKKGLEPICISVNFSRKHLEEDGLVDHIVSIIDRHGIDPQYIEIELTESEDYQNFEVMTALVEALKVRGIRTSMDDFGTGFSSLNMIKQVDLKMIKIDRSFIPLETEYPGKEKDLLMFNYIVNMIKGLDKKTIAEGVETKEQLEYLKNVGCDLVQGYVFDKPLPADAFEQRLLKGYS